MTMQRQCGGCSACCKLLPIKREKNRHYLPTISKMIELKMLTMRDAMRMVNDFDKPAGERCPHQRHGKGCAIYDRRPFGCRMWNCRWLVNDDTADLHRPDRSHYVIDVAPDYITRRDDDGIERVVPVVQVWVDPNYPDAHKDPALRRYLERRAEEGMAALIRFNNREAIVLLAPAFTDNGEWLELRSAVAEGEHTIEQKIAALGDMKITMQDVL